MVTCRVCKEKFDISSLQEGTDWIQPSPRFYYHKKCYETWKNGKVSVDKDWIPLIYDFLARDLKVSYNYHLCETQRKKFIEQHNFTNKGIYFALKYFYELKKGDFTKAHEGIGIVPFVYKESAQYWIGIEKKQQGTLLDIEQQIRERLNCQKISVKASPKKKKVVVQKFSFDDIMEGDND